jgi:hypothetical protein
MGALYDENNKGNIDRRGFPDIVLHIGSAGMQSGCDANRDRK